MMTGGPGGRTDWPDGYQTRADGTGREIQWAR